MEDSNYEMNTLTRPDSLRLCESRQRAYIIDSALLARYCAQ